MRSRRREEDPVRREHHFGSFRREIELPGTSEPDKVKVDATNEDGILAVTLPKSNEVLASPRRIALEVH